MMKQIDVIDGAGRRRFGPGHFDLIVIDEAHRSVYAKYGELFRYFDSLLLGLTATPKDEIDHNTYKLFAMEDGVPTDSYDLHEAAAEGYLVLPKAVKVPLKFMEQGIRYADLSEEEKAEWDAKEWTEDGDIPDAVGRHDMNKILFNEDTVDKMLETLMTRGHRVEGGDRLGKTIIFAKNNDHARYIEERYNANYPQCRPHRARDHVQGDVRPVPHRRLLQPEEPAERPRHRHLRRHARHRHRRARGGEPGLRQAGLLQDQVLADDRPRHPPAPRPLWPRPRQPRAQQAELLRL